MNHQSLTLRSIDYFRWLVRESLLDRQTEFKSVIVSLWLHEVERYRERLFQLGLMAVL
jgi:hypothetical protein